jgi:hypothetical protein
VFLFALHKLQNVLLVQFADFLDVTDELVLGQRERIFELCDLLKNLLFESSLAQLKLIQHDIQLATHVSCMACIQVLSFRSLVDRVVLQSSFGCIECRLPDDFLEQLVQVSDT